MPIDQPAIVTAAAALERAILDPKDPGLREEVARWLNEARARAEAAPGTTVLGPRLRADPADLKDEYVVTFYAERLLLLLRPVSRAWSRRPGGPWPGLEGAEDLPRATRVPLNRLAQQLLSWPTWEPLDGPGRDEVLDLLEKVGDLDSATRRRAPKTPEEPPRYLFRDERMTWHIRFDGEEGRSPVKGNLGLGYIRKLLEAPNQPMTGPALEGCSPDIANVRSSRQEVVDGPGVANLLRRKEELEAWIEEAQQLGGVAAEERHARELVDVQRELDKARGPRGKKKFIDAPEDQALKRVAKNIKNALIPLDKKMPNFRAHIERTIARNSPALTYIPARDPSHPEPAWQF